MSQNGQEEICGQPRRATALQRTCMYGLSTDLNHLRSLRQPTSFVIVEFRLRKFKAGGNKIAASAFTKFADHSESILFPALKSLGKNSVVRSRLTPFAPSLLALKRRVPQGLRTVRL